MPVGNLQNDRSQRAALESLLDGTSSSLAAKQNATIAANALGPGSVARSVEDELRDLIVPAKRFGVIGDGTTNDTAGLQAFFDYVTQNSRTGVLPPGTYKITGAITIGSAGGTNLWVVEGYGANIVQYADNTPILNFTKENNRRFAVRGINFSYNTQQTVAQTSANCIYFDSDTDNNYGHYLIQLADLHFGKCYGGIVSNNGGSNRVPVWQTWIERCESLPTQVGPVVDLRQSGSGQPQVHINGMYIRGDTSAVTPILLSNVSTGTLRGIEVVTPINTVQIQVESSENIIIDGFRVERATLGSGTNSKGFITLSGTSAVVRGVEIQGCTFSASSGAYYALRLIGACNVEASQINSRSQTFQNSAALYAFDIASSSIATLRTRLLGSGMSECIGGSGSDLRLIRPDGTRRFVLADDAAVSFTPSNSGNTVLANVLVSGQSGYSGSCICDVTSGSPWISALTGSGANFLAGTTALAGTTGTDAKLNVAAAGNLFYVENRSGASRTIMVSFR